MQNCPPMEALAEVLLHRHRQEEQQLYALQLLWLMGLQQFALAGGRDYPMPEPMKLFMPEGSRDMRGAEEIRRETAERLLP